jgi:hypothetical protein
MGSISGKIRTVNGIWPSIKKFIASRWLLWFLVSLVILFALLHEALQLFWDISLSPGSQALLWLSALVGLGFSPEDVTSPSQYGLRGMCEQAELIGADFQVISRPQAGTVVRLRLPVKGLEEVIL